MDGLLAGIGAAGRGESYLAWMKYRAAAVVFDRLVAARAETDGLVDTGMAEAITHLTAVQGVSRRTAYRLMDEAIALRDRLPEVGDCLRDGVICLWQAQLIVSRTDLLDESAAALRVDTDLAAVLRSERRSWTRARLRDLIDRIVYRYDPDGVRERRRAALDGRRMWTAPNEDGTADIGAVMAAENVRIAAAAVTALADAVCDGDGRTRPQRSSDAMFALLSGTPFGCECGRSDCIAQIPAPATVPPADSRIVLHVVCDEATLAGTADHAGFLDGHGVLGAEHVRDIAARPDTTIAHLVPPGTASEPDGTFLLAGSLPSDAYRPSRALDTAIRIRDGYCTSPGCDRPAWECDLDHVTEYDHTHPDAGGQTSADGMNAKCRPDHVRKTFGTGIDDQYRHPVTGRLHAEHVTDTGIIIATHVAANGDLFPGLRRIRFHNPPRPAPPRDSDVEDPPAPTPSRTRLAAKYARRRAERHRNRKAHKAEPPPPF
ncbi:HNH endonuclease signature motif containing protein [Gordonia sinesedis]